jgi:hypothetical protein
MKKYNNEDGSVAALLLTLFFSLVISSLTISFLLLEVYGVSVAGVDLPSSSDTLLMYSNEQSYKNGTFDLELNRETWYGDWDYIAGTGVVFQSLGLSDYSYLVIKNIQVDANGFYQNSYFINNSVHSNYCIGLRITSGSDTNEICITDDGFHVPNYIYLTNTKWGNKYFYPYPNANQIENVSIKTIYNEDDLTADFYFNGVKYFTVNQLAEPIHIFDVFGVYYGGISANIQGFTLEEFQTENNIINTNAKTQDTLALISGFIITVLKIVAWNVDSIYLPLELNLIFIKTQLAGIIICIIMIIRGIG